MGISKEYHNFHRDYERFGFKTQVLSEQTFNIVSVTKRNEPNNVADFHFPITGEAKVRTMIETAPNGVNFAHTVVTFKRRDYGLHYIRNGMGGQALVIAIHNFDDERYMEWELYTDTPSVRPDHPDEVLNADTIRKEAKRMNALPRR